VRLALPGPAGAHRFRFRTKSGAIQGVVAGAGAGGAGAPGLRSFPLSLDAANLRQGTTTLELFE